MFMYVCMYVGLQLVIPNVRYSEGSVNPKVRYSMYVCVCVCMYVM